MAFDLADLLTAGGQAMGRANLRLAATGAPALLRDFELTLALDVGTAIPVDAPTLLLTGEARPNPQIEALLTEGKAVTVRALYIAAPSTFPVPPVPVIGVVAP